MSKQQVHYDKFIKPSIVSNGIGFVIYREDQSDLYDNPDDFYQVRTSILYTAWGPDYEYPIFIDDYGNAIAILN